MSTSCLAVIPARGGSKRIPQKNIVALGGKPLLCYTIEAALEAGVFERVIVSTDDSAIAHVARSAGAEVPFLRRSDLADDHTPASAVTVDAVEWLDAHDERFDCIAQLMPNCPLRDADDVVASLESFLEAGARFQLSVTRYGWLNPWWALKRTEDGVLTPLFSERLEQRSQDLPELFCPSGAIWWGKSAPLLEAKTFHAPDRRGFELPWHRALDIDDHDDLVLAEAVLAWQGRG